MVTHANCNSPLEGESKRTSLRRSSIGWGLQPLIHHTLKTLLVVTLILTPTISNAQEFSKEDLNEITATMINLKGLLCAKVMEMRPLKLENTYEVTCIEYRGGSGMVRYIFNPRENTVYKAD